MELNGYRLLLPEGTLDYFDLVDVKESVNEVVFYLEGRKYRSEEVCQIRILRVKAFMTLFIVQDFPRSKKVFLNIRRRRWILRSIIGISRNWRMVAVVGTRMTQDFASFLKELY